MIKSNLPIPYLYRLRLRDRSSRYDHLSTGPAAATVKQGSVRLRRSGNHSVRLRVSASIIRDFVREYERFTSVLCAAAMSGCGTRCEQEYIRARRWFIGHYYRITPLIRPYISDLGFAPGRSGAVVIRDYAGQRKEVDALEELFLAQSLKDLLDSDDGTLLPRLNRLSEAIYR